jgi:tyrosyl-tRNA synthetase
MENAFDVLAARGFIEQTTNDDEIRELLEKERITFYIGYDPTADSLTAGHFLTIMAASHLQRAGHWPIFVVGGGTGMVGDPSGREEMRRLMTTEEVNRNLENFKTQLSRFINFSDGSALMLNNADWLLKLNYIDFLREYGALFSVNRMLTMEAYRSRLESGLTFFEFNYMIMQAYDFLELNRRYNCVLQAGGADQWSNILAGIDLIRRVERKPAYGATFKLLTTPSGQKMGKTAKGALWLAPEKTSPYDFYQYWRNIDDSSVFTCLNLLTFLSAEEIEKLKNVNINEAKEILAFETTKNVHGQDAAQSAQNAARSLFSGAAGDSGVPARAVGENNINVINLLIKTELVKTTSEARRLIAQGGLKIDGKKIENIDEIIEIKDDGAMIQKGKKIFLKVTV